MSLVLKFEDYLISTYDRIKISSNDIKKGDIFLALKGKKYHGNKFIDLSLNKGAKYCITDKKYNGKSTKVILVDNVLKFLTKIAIRKRSLYKGKVV